MKYKRILPALGLALLLASPSWAQLTRRISVSSGGTQGNDASATPSISADGLSVAFMSAATNFVAGDTNDSLDVFCRNLLDSQTEIGSVGSSGLGNDYSQGAAISADGNFVAFDSTATNLVAGDTNGDSDVFVRSRLLGTTQRVSISSSGAEGDNSSFVATISADGRFVAFASNATNLVTGDTNGVTDIFLRDRLSGVTERISVSDAEAQGNGTSSSPSLSGDGRYVAFVSDATNLVSGDTNTWRDIFVRDRLSGVTVRASVSSQEGQANGHSSLPSISADGRFVAFTSAATGLIGPLAFDTNGVDDVFCRDLVNGSTGRVSISSTAQGNGASSSPSISADGRFVAFASSASNLVTGDTNSKTDVFVHDRSTVTTERVSLGSGGTQGNLSSFDPSISGDGRFVAFFSDATNLVSGDTNNAGDIFLRDRNTPGFTSLCDPGVGGVHACPCGNPPSAAGRGCNNSSGTGGAYLTASGMAYLSTDSLVFTTYAQRPTALSILLQGNAPAAGVVFGQGVRCAGGSLKRLFVKSASSGSITAPGAGDPSVSARSAAKGDTIQAGQSRWYLAYYRDPNVLGGCPATSGFNATQTGRVDWRP